MPEDHCHPPLSHGMAILATPEQMEWARQGHSSLQPASVLDDGTMRMNYLRSRPELRRRIDITRGYRRTRRTNYVITW